MAAPPRKAPGLMDPSTELGRLMQSAMKIKSSQLDQQRKRYDSYPAFLQSTLWAQGAYLELRAQPLDERMPKAMALKEEGNECFRQKAYSDAIDRYEHTLGAFRFMVQNDPEWRSQGITDDTLQLVDELGRNDAEREGIRGLKLTCYNNLAASYLARAAQAIALATAEPGTSAVSFSLPCFCPVVTRPFVCPSWSHGMTFPHWLRTSCSHHISSF